MFINRLLVERVRNLDSVSLNDFALLNVFIGPNGAGKTSLLEALAIVSLGRSFRSTKIQPVIQRDQPSLRVFVECVSDNGQKHRLGIERDRQNSYRVRIDGAASDSLARLSSCLPVLVLDASAFDLLDGPPAQRCRFIDWGVFHVEHRFYQCWRDYRRILKQRNSLLRQKVGDYAFYEPWDKELCRLAVEIEHYRLHFLLEYQPVLNLVIAELDSDLSEQCIHYRNGWQKDKIAFDELEQALQSLPDVDKLHDLLKSSFDRDCKYQRTHLGPQRADMQIRTYKQDVRDVYSRGQKKTLVAAMKLSQAKLLNEIRDKRPVLLLDDLPAELDDAHLQRFIAFVSKERLQCFISSIDDRLGIDENQENSRMFHVEHGRIRPVDGNMLATGET